MTFKIFVPSKGRAGKAKTIENLVKEELDFTCLVEPQELEQYQEAYPTVDFLCLKESNKGIGYVRQFILTHNREVNLAGWYWMLDDDISSLSEQQGTKNVRRPFGEVLVKAFFLFSEIPNVSQAALEYQQFSWSAKKDLAYNSYCDVCVCINVHRTQHVNYRSFCDLKEDRDFTLQILGSGYYTIRTSRFGFSAPKNGSNEGGLREVYLQSGRELEAVKRMCLLYPELITSQVKSDGRVDCKINWRYFKKNNLLGSKIKA